MNRHTYIGFFMTLIAITAFQLVAIFLLQDSLPLKDTSTAIFFLAILTAAIFPIASIGKKSNDAYTFIISAYISIGVRFILSMCYILYYKYTRDHYPIGFIFAFFISYILYTIFEIYWLTAKLRPNLKENESSDGLTNK